MSGPEQPLGVSQQIASGISAAPLHVHRLWNRAKQGQCNLSHSPQNSFCRSCNSWETAFKPLGDCAAMAVNGRNPSHERPLSVLCSN